MLDLLFLAISMASRYMDQPHEIHWRAAKRILNFVQGTRTHGIFYKAKSDLDLIGFTDSDWAGDSTDKNIHIRICVHAYRRANQLVKQET